MEKGQGGGLKTEAWLEVHDSGCAPTLSVLPALIIELKWNKTADTALCQIRDRNYPAVLKNYGGAVISAGISYDEKTEAHNCRIEMYE